MRRPKRRSSFFNMKKKKTCPFTLAGMKVIEKGDKKSKTDGITSICCKRLLKKKEKYYEFTEKTKSIAFKRYF